MAETNIPVTSGSGNNVDVFATAGGNLRQAVVIGDSSVNANVAPVQSTDPTSATQGVVVRDVNTSAIVSRLNQTLSVQLDPGHLLGSVTANVGSGTMAVFFDQSAPTVKAVPSTGTFTVAFDPGHTLGSLTSVASITNTVNVQLDPGHTLGKVDAGLGTFNVQLDPGHTLGNIGTIASITGSVAVYFDRANPSVNATFSSTSLEVVPTTGSRKTMDDAAAAQRVLIVGSQSNASLVVNGTVTANAGTGTMTVAFDPGHTLGSISTVAAVTNITNSISVYIGATAGTMGVRVGQVDGTVAVYFSQARPVVLADNLNTASIFTVSGSFSGVSALGLQLVAPSANASFKVFAFSLQTTGVASMVARFTNGAGSATEYWRGLITPASSSSTGLGANLAVQPPGYLFATGVSTTLALHLDTGTLVHYSVSYIKESA